MNYSSFEQKYMVNRIPAAVPGASGKARFQMEKSAARQIQDPPEVKDILESIGYVSDQYLDVGAATVKGVTQGTVGLPGDLEGLVRTVANSLGADVNEETLAPTTEEVKKWFDQNIGKVGDGKNPYETIGEFAALGKPTELAVQGAVKGVKKTKDVIQNLDAPLPRPTGAIKPGDAMPKKIDAQKQPAVQRTTDDFGFYSKALEETQKLKQEKGTGQQFKQMLVKAGVKQEEIDWLGLEDVFKEKKITKDDIVKHINDNRIKLREVVATGESKFSMEFGEGVELTPAQTYGDNYIDERADELISFKAEDGETLGYDDAVKMAEEEYYDDPVMKYVDSKTGYTITGNDSLGYSIFESEADTVGEGSWKNAFATSTGRKRYDLRRDESGDLEIYSLDEAEVQARGLFENSTEAEQMSLVGDTRWSDHVEPDGENYQELRFQLDDDEVKFTEGVHFSDDKNNLFHIRTTDRDYNGEKVLYIEELQSDWGQTGRDRGFKPEKKEEKILNDKVTTSKNELKNKLNEYTVLEDNGTKTSFVDFEIKKLKDSIKRANPDVPDDAPIMKNVENLEDSDLINIFNQFLDAVAEGKIFKNNEQIQGNFKNRMVNGVMTLKSDAPLDFISLEKLTRNHRALQLELSPYLVERSPFVTSTDKWTQLAIKRLLSKAIDEGYDYVSFSPGDVQYERWNNEGLITYYDYIVPKNAEKVLKKIDKNAILYTRRNDLGLDEDRAAIGKESLQELQTESKIPNNFFDNLYEKKNNNVLLKKGLFTIKITPKVKDSVSKGQSMFSVAPIAAGSVAVSQGENDGN